MLKRVTAPLIALAILGLATQPAIADVGSAHWPRAEEPLMVYVADGLTPSWDVAIDHAISVWNRNPHVHYQRVGAGACDYAEPPNTIDICPQHAIDMYGALALTYMFVHPDNLAHLYHGQIDVNIDKSWWTGRQYRTMCHELGHGLGLWHRPELSSQSCMVARIAYMVAPVAPDAQDYADLNTMYDHLDP